MATMKEAITNPPKPAKLLNNLQFGQEMQIKIPKNVENKS